VLTPLLLALDEEGDRQRQPAVHLLPGGQRLDDGHQLALVVDGTARHHLRPVRPLAQHRLERRRSPELERVGRLDVVVAVVEQPRAGCIAGIGVGRQHHRLAGGLVQVGCEASATQAGNQPFRRPPGIGRMRGVGADRWDAQERAPALDGAIEAAVDSGKYGFGPHRRSCSGGLRGGDGSPVQRRRQS
jgi:hypothetical protein